MLGLCLFHKHSCLVRLPCLYHCSPHCSHDFAPCVDFVVFVIDVHELVNVVHSDFMK